MRHFNKPIMSLKDALHVAEIVSANGPYNSTDRELVAMGALLVLASEFQFAIAAKKKAEAARDTYSNELDIISKAILNWAEKLEKAEAALRGLRLPHGELTELGDDHCCHHLVEQVDKALNSLQTGEFK